jgi:predicted nucleic acid-binding protein
VIAGDSSSLVAYFAGSSGADVEAIDAALSDGHLVLPCVALTELLSAKKLPAALARTLLEIPRLEPGDGFWERAGGLRAKILRRGWRARLADTLIAQLCIDHNVSLVTRDEDFRHFATVGSLRLT